MKGVKFHPVLTPYIIFALYSVCAYLLYTYYVAGMGHSYLILPLNMTLTFHLSFFCNNLSDLEEAFHLLNPKKACKMI